MKPLLGSIVFDMDGVMSDSMDEQGAVFSRVLFEAYGLPPRSIALLVLHDSGCSPEYAVREGGARCRDSNRVGTSLTSRRHSGLV